MQYGFEPVGNRGLRPISIGELTRGKTPRVMRTSVTLPSQHQAYAVCVEFAKKWFLEKFKDGYFNSIYVEGTHSFDEFRKFSEIDQKLKRANPLLAIIPTIDMSHNRQWIDSTPELPLLLRRSRIEGTFFNDNKKGLFCQLMFKTILMNFTYKIRSDTRSEQLDMMEFIKFHHRAGWTETRNLAVDIHVPKQIILQIAFDNGFKITDDGEIEEPMKLLEYLNSHSYIPFLYKLRCSTGNKEFFLKVPNCVAHIKAEMPSMDDGERQDMLTTNYNIDFQIEIEMTAPYCYTYFSQGTQPYLIIHKPTHNNQDKIAIMAATMTILPELDCNGWDRFIDTEYAVDKEDLNKPIDIDFKELFHGHELEKVIEYTKAIAISPSIFLNFIMFNDSIDLLYEMDWNTMICHIKQPITNCNTIIGIYADRKYINEALIYFNEMDKKSARVE